MAKVSKKTGQRFCNVVFPEIVTQKVVWDSNDLTVKKLSARNYPKILSKESEYTVHPILRINI